MKFKNWIKIQENGGAAGGSAAGGAAGSAGGAAAAIGGTAPALAGPVSSSEKGGGTTSKDIAKVPMKLGCGQNCGKDFFKNWYWTKRKKKST